MFRNLTNRYCPAPPLRPEGKTAACIAFAALALYLWVLPTAGTIALRNLAFASLLFVTLWSAWRYKLRLHFPLAWPWLVYGMVAIASLGYAADPLVSVREIKHEIGYGILILMLTATWVRRLQSLEFILVLVILGDLLLVGSALVKIVVFDPFWHYPLEKLSSLLYRGIGKNIYNGVGNFSTYLITVLPLIAAYTFLQPSNRSVARNWLAILLLLNIFAIFLTGNRMGLVVLTAEILFATTFLIARKPPIPGWRTVILMAIILAIVSGLIWAQLQLRPPGGDPRWPIWEWALKNLFAAPLTGAGFGRTTLCLQDPAFCATFRFEHTHNMLLNKGAQMGFPGIAAFLLLLATTLRALWPRRSVTPDPRLWGYSLAATTMYVGVFLKNMTDDFFVSHNSLLYWALVGIVLGAIAGEAEKAER